MPHLSLLDVPATTLSSIQSLQVQADQLARTHGRRRRHSVDVEHLLDQKAADIAGDRTLCLEALGEFMAAGLEDDLVASAAFFAAGAKRDMAGAGLVMVMNRAVAWYAGRLVLEDSERNLDHLVQSIADSQERLA